MTGEKQFETIADSTIYTKGGTVPPNKLYIERSADKELFDLCCVGVYAYVLTSRQMGKSSIIVRTLRKLRNRELTGNIEIEPTHVDLTKTGSEKTTFTPEQWYYGIIQHIASRLKLKTDLDQWWEKKEKLTLPQRFTDFFEEVVLTEKSGRVVIFFDEIDSTLKLNFSDDFFAAIRYLYNARATSPELNRLSFVFAGTATPGDLIKNEEITPFNIGQRVDLKDFSAEELLPLTNGLGLSPDAGRQVLEWIYEWTNGQPYLTQKIFAAVAEQNRTEWTKDEVDAVVAENFFGEQINKDINLAFVSKMLTKPEYIEQNLEVYRNVLRGREVLDEERSPINSRLKIIGIVRRENGVLRVRNEIYRHMFNEDWVKRHMPVNWKRRIVRAAGAAALIFLILCLPLAIFAVRQWRIAEAKAIEAQESAAKAEEQREIAEKERTIAEEQRDIAKSSQNEAINQRAIAEDEKARAVELAKLAESRRIEAERQTKIANNALLQAEESRKDAVRAAEAERIAKVEAQNQTAQLKISEAQLVSKTIELEDSQRKLLDKNKELEAVNKLQEKQARLLIELKKIADARRLGCQAQDFIAKNSNETGVLLAAASLKLTSNKSVNAFPDTTAVSAITTGMKIFSPVSTSSPQPFGSPILQNSLANSAVISPHSISPDVYLLTSSTDKTVRLFDIQYNSSSRQLADIVHGNDVTDIIFGGFEPNQEFKNREFGFPDSRMALTLDKNNVVRLFNLDLFLNLLNANPEEAKQLPIKFDPDMKGGKFSRAIKAIKIPTKVDFVALGGGHREFFTANGDEIRRWNTDTLEQEMLIKNPKSSEKYISFSLNLSTSLIAVADGDEAQIWNVITGVKIADTNDDDGDGDVVSVAFSPKNDVIATISKDPAGSKKLKVGLWFAANGKPATLPYETEEPIKSLRFSPDGNLLALVSDKAIRTLKIPSRFLDEKQTTVSLESASVFSHDNEILDFDFDDQNRFLATATVDGQAFIWTLGDGQNNPRKIQFNGKVNDVSFTSDLFGTEKLVTATDDPQRSVQIWDLSGYDKLKPLTEKTTSATLGNALAFSLDENWLAIGQYNVFPSNDNRGAILLKSIKDGITRKLPGHTGGTNSLVFNQENNGLISAGNDGAIRFWNIMSGEQTRELPYEDKEKLVIKAAIDSKNQFIVSATQRRPSVTGNSANFQIDVWNLREGKIQTSSPIFNQKINSLEFHPANNRLILTASNDGKVLLWDRENMSAPIQSVVSANTPIRAAAFKPDGLRIAVAIESTVRIFSLEISNNFEVKVTEMPLWKSTPSGPVKPELMSHGQDVVNLAWSRDGKYLATISGYSGSSQSYLHLWAFYIDNGYENAREVLRNPNSEQPSLAGIQSLAFGSKNGENGSYLATGDSSGVVRLWLWKPDDLIKEACSRLTPSSLNYEFLEQFLIDETDQELKQICETSAPITN